MTQRVTIPWAIVAALLMAAPEAFADAAPGAGATFRSLPARERNLAVYDAFWENIEKNHYDPQMLSRAEVRALRDQGRLQAATVGAPAELYGQVFGGISRTLPESQIVAQYRPAVAQSFGESDVSSRDQSTRLATLLASGPGFDEATMHRGAKSLRVVTEVMHDSPAEQAGIRPGWRVISYKSTVDLKTTSVQFTGEFLPLDAGAALAWERGELPESAPDPDKVVKISYAHRPLPTRAPIESRRVARGVHYLRFDGFGDEEFMRPVFNALDQAGSPGLILDLRWNSGGAPQQAQKVAGALLGDGVTLGIEKNAQGSEVVQSIQSASRYDGPLIVLIGPRSGRSSELLAAAIREHRRGKLMGRMTNGSLTTAGIFALPDGGSMSVPTSSFLSSANRKLQGVGVAPDIRVLPTLEDIRAGHDPTIDRAVQVIRAGGGGYSEDQPMRPRARPGELFPPI